MHVGPMFEAPSVKLKLRTNHSAEGGLTTSFDWIWKCTIESPGAAVLDFGAWPASMKTRSHQIFIIFTSDLTHRWQRRG